MTTAAIGSKPTAAPALSPSAVKTERAEVKVSVSSEDFKALSKALDLKALDCERRTVRFFDAKDGSLSANGVLLRARVDEKGAVETTVKLRPVDPAKIPASFQKLEGFKLETDLVGERAVVSASFTVLQKKRDLDTFETKGDADPLFSKAQERFLRDVAKVKVDFRQLRVTEPVRSEVWKPGKSVAGAPLTVERWKLADGSVFLEVSAKTTGSKADKVQRGLEKLLATEHVGTAEEQRTKTAAAMELWR